MIAGKICYDDIKLIDQYNKQLYHQYSINLKHKLSVDDTTCCCNMQKKERKNQNLMKKES